MNQSRDVYVYCLWPSEWFGENVSIIQSVPFDEFDRIATYMEQHAEDMKLRSIEICTRNYNLWELWRRLQESGNYTEPIVLKPGTFDIWQCLTKRLSIIV